MPFSTASELVRQIRDGETSASECLTRHLEHIERENPRLNAIVTLDTERAVARAAELDAARARGEKLGPLHGVPFTLKDCHETKGVRTTVGAPSFENHVPRKPSAME